MRTSAPRRGSALVEVLAAVAIMSIATVGTHLVAASSRLGQADSDVNQAAARSVSSLLDALKPYVTADASEATLEYAPGGSWRLPGDQCSWALQAGCVHEAGAFLDDQVRRRHPEARLTYEVSRANSDSPSSVSVSLRWR